MLQKPVFFLQASLHASELLVSHVSKSKEGISLSLAEKLKMKLRCVPFRLDMLADVCCYGVLESPVMRLNATSSVCERYKSLLAL